MARRDFPAVREAFLALTALGDEQAIPLAIDRMDLQQEQKAFGYLSPALEKVTGMKLGMDPSAWRQWWESGRSSSRVSDRSARP